MHGVMAGALALVLIGWVAACQRVWQTLFARAEAVRGRRERMGHALIGEPIRVVTKDGIEIHCRYAAGALPAAVVLPPGYRCSMHDVMPLAAGLNVAGFHVAVFDWRSCGAANAWTGGVREVEDLAAVIHAVRARVDGQIGVTGQSFGAVMALKVAASDAPVGAVWADSPYESVMTYLCDGVRRRLRLPGRPFVWPPLALARFMYGVRLWQENTVESARRVAVPTLVVVSGRDRLVGDKRTSAVRRALGTNLVETWRAEEAEHAGMFDLDRRAYVERSAAFFRKALVTRERGEVDDGVGYVVA